MDDSLNLVSADFLQSTLSTKYIGRPTLYYKTTTSTNTLGFQKSESGTPHGTVILADQQTHGKGRLGRTWHSPTKKNLYFSIVLTQLIEQSLISWIPLLSGVVLAECLESASALPIYLKWPNDVLCRDKKLAGILCEGKQKQGNLWTYVVGIGVNMNSDEGDFPQELRLKATSLAAESRHQYNIQAFLSTFLEKFETRYEHLLNSGIHDIRSQYILRCQTLHQSVLVYDLTGTQLKGYAVNIDTDGALQIIPSEPKQSDTPISIRSGDVYHVR